MMARLGILISLCLFCSRAIAAEKHDFCGYKTVYGTVFSLSISSAFGGGMEFNLCARRDPGASYITVTRYAAENDKHGEPLKVSLNDSRYQKLLTLYEDALDYNVKDNVMGLDGSIWCLETARGSTYSKACFWSPEVDSEKRQLAGLAKLGRELLSIAGWKEP
jgi:hypothetical protein